MAKDGGICARQRCVLIGKNMTCTLLPGNDCVELYCCSTICCHIEQEMIFKMGILAKCTIYIFFPFFLKTDWESGGSSGDCLLQAVCRCSLAALLKHSGLQNEACWQDRSEAHNHNYRY